MRRNRTETEILASVLSFCAEPQRISSIVHNANIPHPRLQPMLDHLISAGLMQKEEHSDAVYTTTRQGHEFLTEFRRYERMCGMYAIKP